MYALPPLQPLNLRTKYARREWKTLQSWEFPLPSGDIMMVPKGYIFDGASVPRPLYVLFNPTGRLFYASLAHDFAVKEQKIVANGKELPMTDKLSDDLFWWLARESGVSRPNAWLAWAGVRIGSLFRRRM